jgi:membrane protein
MSEPAPNSQGKSTSGRVVTLLKEIYYIWMAERPSQFAAALAYYAIFAFVPVIYIALTLTNFFVAQLSVAEQFYAQVSDVLGEEMGLAVEKAVTNLAERSGGSTLLTSVIGFGALVFSASMMFFQLQHVLNTVWKVPPSRGGQTRAYVRNRLFAFLMLLGVALLLVLAAVVDVVISIVHRYVAFESPIPVLSILAVLGLATLSFAALYKLLPNARVAWRDVWLGAGLAALLVTLGIYLVGWYLGASQFRSPLEAAGGVAVFLTVFYFLGQIFVLGAVFIRVYASTFGSGIVPRETADTPGQESVEESA